MKKIVPRPPSFGCIIDPAIGRDVLALGQVRRPALLRQVFAVAAGSPAQIVSLSKNPGAAD